MNNEANHTENMHAATDHANRYVRLISLAGILGIVAAALILAAPELGFNTSAVGGVLAASGSAFATLLARR